MSPRCGIRLPLSFEQGSDPGGQFAEVERFDHVVVGSCIESVQFVVCRSQSREHQYGDSGVYFPDFATQLESVHLG